jgi:defect-in-organelle-trafficking protein DotD
MEEIGMEHSSLQASVSRLLPFTPRRRSVGNAGNQSSAARSRALGLKCFPAAPILACALVMAGCAAIHPVPTDVETPGMPNPETALQRSMQHVDTEMAELGQLSPSAVRTVQPVMPADLQRTVSFAWAGSLDQAVAKLAASVGYTFYRTAPVNAQQLDVAIRLSSVPAYQVFEALGAEAGARATVAVDPLHHQVEVIHHV